MNASTNAVPTQHVIDPGERRWLERKALELAREFKCPLPDALVAARCEFESLKTRPKAIVIPLVEWRLRRRAAAQPELSIR